MNPIDKIKEELKEFTKQKQDFIESKCFPVYVVSSRYNRTTQEYDLIIHSYWVITNPNSVDPAEDLWYDVINDCNWGTKSVSLNPKGALENEIKNIDIGLANYQERKKKLLETPLEKLIELGKGYEDS